MTRYRPVHQAKYRCQQAATTWRQLLKIVRDSAEQPGYRGPAPQVVERILAEIVATQDSVVHWFAAVAAQPRRRPIRVRKIQVTMRRPGTDPAPGALEAIAAEAFRDFAEDAERRRALKAR